MATFLNYQYVCKSIVNFVLPPNRVAIYDSTTCNSPFSDQDDVTVDKHVYSVAVWRDIEKADLGAASHTSPGKIGGEWRVRQTALRPRDAVDTVRDGVAV